MTQQKSLKRRVRDRMSKTGERYTAARRQVIAKAVEPEPTDAIEPEPTAVSEPTPAFEPSADLAPAPDSPFRGDRSASDEALIQRTGQDWSHWYRVLQAWSAADRPHPDIARYLNVEHGVDGWWAQELTVRYEMAIGRRVPGQRPDGWEVSVSRTFAVPVARLFEAVVDDGQRAQWLARELRLRTSKAFKTARFDWTDPAERIAVGFLAKGDRSTATFVHQRLPDAAAGDVARAFWREALASLEKFLAVPRSAA
jgi:hypothetical protein